MTTTLPDSKRNRCDAWLSSRYPKVSEGKAMYEQMLNLEVASKHFNRKVVEASRDQYITNAAFDGMCLIVTNEEVLPSDFDTTVLYEAIISDWANHPKSPQPSTWTKFKSSKAWKPIERRYSAILNLCQTDSETGCNWLIHAKRLESIGKVDDALDVIYLNVDSAMRQGRFSEINRTLDSTNPSLTSTDLLLGLLTATLPARTKLPARSGLLRRAEETIKQRGEYEEGLLAGL